MRRVGALPVVTAKTPENGDGRVHQVIPAARVAQGRAPRHGLRHDVMVGTDAYRALGRIGRWDARLVGQRSPQVLERGNCRQSTGHLVVSSGQILSVSVTVNSRLASPSSTSSASTNISPLARCQTVTTEPIVNQDTTGSRPKIASTKLTLKTALTALSAATQHNVRCTRLTQHDTAERGVTNDDLRDTGPDDGINATERGFNRITGESDLTTRVSVADRPSASRTIGCRRYRSITVMSVTTGSLPVLPPQHPTYSQPLFSL